MWWQSSRLDRIEANLEANQKRTDRIETNIDRLAEISEATNRRIDRLAEISEATNRRIDRFVEATAQQIESTNERTAQLQRAVEYLLSRDR